MNIKNGIRHWIAYGLLVSAFPAWSDNVDAENSSRLPLEEIQTFVSVFETISQGYVDELNDKQILQKALKGMVSALDPHSEYLTKDEIESFQEMTSGNYAGIGVEVEMKEGRLIIISPLDDSPASRAGMLSGDSIIRIDDSLVSGMGIQEVTMLMKGKVGSSVTLDIERDGEIITLSVERELLDSQSLDSRWLGEGIAYIRISQFQGDTDSEFDKELASLQSEANIKGLVIDLRNNPGGVLQSAVGVVDTLIDNGLIVYTDGRHAQSKVTFSASKKTALPTAPVVVLINEGSASASEIVAGALQDHGRGLIMGTESFGKGSVQTVIPLADGSAVKLTTALYFTPNGRSIQAQGIEPDILVPNVSLVDNEAAFFVKEAELSGHLKNGTGGKDRTSGDVDVSINNLAYDDFQLYQAYTVLNAYPQLQKRSH
ncbi:S41 family peptidase [Marinomonas sp. 15G1-11]|mgnify:CR=1 FL=1|uniref:S41 family peptidase n=1 Tax=Marinomonas phaeophyticola TaxID=3004091 RepID=A0ABT4JZ03_9GAMM|nr:S41 family peptidase [Marinomonas sp. 15G1-11]MCZ2723627.1 S41 family peptidase [Marinomonas sp. 15G1-11]